MDFFLERRGGLAVPPAIAFYGGEPLLCPETIAEVIEYVKSLNLDPACTFHLTTNGLALNDSGVRDLVASYQISILVSVDGPERIHDKYRRTKAGTGSHAVVTRGLEALLEEYPQYYAEKVRFNAVCVSQGHQEEIVEFFDEWPLAQATDLDDLRCSGVDTLGSSDVLEALLSIDQEAANPSPPVESTRQRFVRNRKSSVHPKDGLGNFGKNELLRIAKREIAPPTAEIRPSGFCLPGTRKLFVTAEGDFAVCEKVGSGAIIGSLARGFDVDAVQRALKGYYSMWSDRCSKCIAQRFCAICPAVLKGEDGEISGAQFERECRGQRAAILAALEDFTSIGLSNPAYIDGLENTLVI